MIEPQRRRRPGRTPLPPFQRLLDDHAATVLRFLVSRVGVEAAEDCFQETWLAALRAYSQLDGAENLRGWLLTIARNKAHDARRAAARRPVPMGDMVDQGSAPASMPDASDEVWDDVHSLPGKQRTAIVLRYAEDKGYGDIAREMATTETAARRNVHEGIKKLRRNRT